MNLSHVSSLLDSSFTYLAAIPHMWYNAVFFSQNLIVWLKNKQISGLPITVSFWISFITSCNKHSVALNTKLRMTSACYVSTLKSTGNTALAYLCSFTSYDTYFIFLQMPRTLSYFCVFAQVLPFALHTFSIPTHLSCQKLSCPSGAT